MPQDARLASLEATEARVTAAIAEPRNREQLTAEQLARLREQEAEIAELRTRIEAVRAARGAGSSNLVSTRPVPDIAPPVSKQTDSSRRNDRHNVIELPPPPSARYNAASRHVATILTISHLPHVYVATSSKHIPSDTSVSVSSMHLQIPGLVA